MFRARFDTADYADRNIDASARMDHRERDALLGKLCRTEDMHDLQMRAIGRHDRFTRSPILVTWDCESEAKPNGAPHDLLMGSRELSILRTHPAFSFRAFRKSVLMRVCQPVPVLR